MNKKIVILLLLLIIPFSASSEWRFNPYTGKVDYYEKKTAEIDPIWTSEKDNYYTKTEIDGFGFLTEETDPIFSAWDKDYDDLINKPDLSQLHDRLHAIDSTDEHIGVSGAIENNFISFNASGLPKDSGYNSGSFEPTLSKGNLTEATSSVLTITGGTNAVMGSGTNIQVKQAGSAQSGYLSSTDWNTFNNKQNALTTGNLTASSPLSFDNTRQVIGGTAGLSISQATTSTDGYLSSTDWNTFNNKVGTESDPVYTSWYNSGSPTLANLTVTNMLQGPASSPPTWKITSNGFPYFMLIDDYAIQGAMWTDTDPSWLFYKSTSAARMGWDGSDFVFADYDVGALEGIQADSIQVGTSYKITNSGLVANDKISDADKWDGYQFADYLNQAVKTTSNVQHAKLSLGTTPQTELLYIAGKSRLAYSSGDALVIQDDSQSASTPCFRVQSQSENNAIAMFPAGILQLKYRTLPIKIDPDTEWPYYDFTIFEIGKDSDVWYDGTPAGLYWSNPDTENGRFELRTRGGSYLGLAASYFSGYHYGAWGGDTIPYNKGGTSQISYSNGQLLIGNSSGGLTKNTLTGTTNQVNISNASGSITLSTPQNIHTSATPQFLRLGLGAAASGTYPLYINGSGYYGFDVYVVPDQSDQIIGKIRYSSGNLFTFDSDGDLVAVGSVQAGSSSHNVKSGTTGTTYTGNARPKRSFYVPVVSMWPSTTGGSGALATAETSTYKLTYYYSSFDGSTDQSMQFTTPLPPSWDGSYVTAIVYYIPDGTTGGTAIEWMLQGVLIGDNGIIDTSFGTAVDIRDTIQTAGRVHITPESGNMTIAGTLSGAKYIQWKLTRDADDGTYDNNTNTAKLLGVLIKYTATQESDG